MVACLVARGCMEHVSCFAARAPIGAAQTRGERRTLLLVLCDVSCVTKPVKRYKAVGGRRRYHAVYLQVPVYLYSTNAQRLYVAIKP